MNLQFSINFLGATIAKTMDLFLIRHGIAIERSHQLPDADRYLTTAGEKKTRKVAERLVASGTQVELILTSPLVRARQTAEILQAAEFAPQIETFQPLAPDGNMQLWVNWLQVHDYRAVALVGHQPDLGHWAEQLVYGHIQDKLILKKAGIIGLKVGDRGSPIANSELFLLTAPKWFL